MAEILQINIREDGSRVVSRNIEGIGEVSVKAASGVDLLKRALFGIGAVLSANKLKEYADAWQSAQGLIRVSTKSTEEAAAVTEKLFAAAQKTRQGFTPLVELYGRLARAGKELGTSQEKIIQVVENVGKILVISATDAGKAKGALLQLGQALGGTLVRAEEFNSMSEGTPQILKVVAENMDGVGGSVERLRQKMLAKKLTSKEFFDALLKGTAAIDSDFKKASKTIGQALTVMSNAFMKWVGETDAAVGISAKITVMAEWIAANFDMIAKTVVAAAGAFALLRGAAMLVGALRAAVLLLNAALLANPFTALAAAIGTAVVALAVFRNDINAGLGDATSLGDVLEALWPRVQKAFTYIADFISSIFGGPLMTAVKKWVGEMDFSIAKIMRDVAKAADFFVGVWKSAVGIVGGLFEHLPAAIKEMFTNALNAILAQLGKFVNESVELLSGITEFAGLGKIQGVEVPQLTNENKGAWERLGKSMSASISDGFKSRGAQDWVEDVLKDAQKIGEARLKNKAKPGFDLSGMMGDLEKFLSEEELKAQAKSSKAAARAEALARRRAEALKKREAQEYESTESHLRTLLNKIAPIEGALLEMKNGEETLTDARNKGIITAQDQIKYIARLTSAYQDSVNPIGKVTRELEQQEDLLKYEARDRDIAAQSLSIYNTLVKEGYPMQQKDVTLLEQRLKVLRDLNEATAARDALMAGSKSEDMRNFGIQTNAMAGLLGNQNSKFTQSDATRTISGLLGQDMIDGTKMQADAMVDSFQTMYEKISVLRFNNVIDEQTAAQMRAKVNAQAYEQQIGNTRTFFSTLTELSTSGNKKIAAIGKAAAITRATIDGIVAVQSALAAAPPPANYALAAAAGIAAAANVAAITAQTLGLMTGGQFKVAGSGGADSQMVAFRASPGETVSVATPTQVRKGSNTVVNGQSSSGPARLNARIINVLDPAVVGDYLSTPQGEEVIMNVMRRNSDQTRMIVNGN